MSALKEDSGPATRSEDVLGQKWDKCLADTAIKMAGGLAVGKTLN